MDRQENIPLTFSIRNKTVQGLFLLFTITPPCLFMILNQGIQRGLHNISEKTVSIKPFSKFVVNNVQIENVIISNIKMYCYIKF